MNLTVAKDGNCPADHFWSWQVRLPGHPAVRRDIDVQKQKEIRKERQDRLNGKKFSNKTFSENQNVSVLRSVTPRSGLPRARLWGRATVRTGQAQVTIS